jgi:predicted nucleotide-binding protein (sugar kinase/HSP70/actin superfamily)
VDKQTLTRIGLPRALLYHMYAPMWTQFFRALGCRVVISPKTNRQILENGVRNSIDESCLAVKIYLGHIQYLADRVDYVFIPRYVSLFRDEKMCVKLFALADIVRNTFEHVNLLELTVDRNNGDHEVLKFIDLGMKMGHNPLEALRAYQTARRSLQEHREKLLARQMAAVAENKATTRVILAAHPYLAYDALLGETVVKLLEQQGVEVLYSDAVDRDTVHALSKHLSTDVYWTYHKEILGSIEYYRKRLDGIVFLMAFPCGPDSLVIELCKHRITDIPILVLVMDELQGDAGLKTRIESFVDILRFQKGVIL